jgi:hypothetical protein
LAEEHDLITSDSELMSWDFTDEGEETAFESTGQMLTLEDTLDETEENITFCFNPVVPNYDDETTARFGVSWTNGVEYVDADTTSANTVIIYGEDVEGWTFGVHD